VGTLAGYIATICVGAALQYLSQFIRPKITIRYWQWHKFIYKVPNNQGNPAPAAPLALPGANQAPAQFTHLLTQSVTIQNFGRERAEWVEIIHRRKPDFFQLAPPLNFTEYVSPTGEHTLRVESLAPKEFFTIQFLCYTHMPELVQVRSEAGKGGSMPWMMVRKFSRWVYVVFQIAIITGGAFYLYWLIKGAIFILKGAGAL
jgi:hypothetical protein